MTKLETTVADATIMIESLGMSLPRPRDVLDRNGAPTGRVCFHADEPIVVTMERLGALRDRWKQDARETADSLLKQATDAASTSRRELEKLRQAFETQRAELRSATRANDESRIQERIRGAVDAAIATRDAEIRKLKSDLAEVTRERDDLRTQKRLWRKSKG